MLLSRGLALEGPLEPGEARKGGKAVLHRIARARSKGGAPLTTAAAVGHPAGRSPLPLGYRLSAGGASPAADTRFVYRTCGTGAAARQPRGSAPTSPAALLGGGARRPAGHGTDTTDARRGGNRSGG
jgi:hypothetical protein